VFTREASTINNDDLQKNTQKTTQKTNQKTTQKTTEKTKDRATRTPIKTAIDLYILLWESWAYTRADMENVMY
jgi:hypothetical protein